MKYSIFPELKNIFTFHLVKAFVVYLPILIKINAECVLFSEAVEVCIVYSTDIYLIAIVYTIGIYYLNVLNTAKSIDET